MDFCRHFFCSFFFQSIIDVCEVLEILGSFYKNESAIQAKAWTADWFSFQLPKFCRRQTRFALEVAAETGLFSRTYRISNGMHGEVVPYVQQHLGFGNDMNVNLVTEAGLVWDMSLRFWD